MDSIDYEEVELSVVLIDLSDLAELGSHPAIVEEHEKWIFIILQKVSTSTSRHAALSTTSECFASSNNR